MPGQSNDNFYLYVKDTELTLHDSWLAEQLDGRKKHFLSSRSEYSHSLARVNHPRGLSLFMLQDPRVDVITRTRYSFILALTDFGGFAEILILTVLYLIRDMQRL